ncbi:tol-pal system YbgF family protein [Pontibacter toksunensis]|uniref:Tol-pal system YbgF family protein n=1 Tax=Pontibacter toksunensis TaxID=1332631 RepID=A0ABW6BRG2_9BACT
MNTDLYEKFEDYLNGEMSLEEKSQFEIVLSSDKELYSEFYLYRAIETEMRVHEGYSSNDSALRNSLQTLNKKYFNSNQQQTGKVVQLYSSHFFRTAVAVAASVVVLLIAYIVLFQPEQSTQRLAENYFDEHLQQLSQTMDASTDSLQLGIAAYNNKEYSKALQYFKGVYHNHPENSEAKRNIGLTYLATEEYDKALQHFDELASVDSLYSNPGLFLKAVTLMLRNEEGDKQEAKQLLQQVVKEEAEGSREATKWLERI